MASDGNNVPDLASVLQALASFTTPQPPGPQQLAPQPPQESTSNTAFVQQLYQLNSSAGSENAPGSGPNLPQPRPQQRVVNDVVERTSSPTIDPATITDWKMGLKCVSFISQANPNFKNAIRKMIHAQHHHERLWYQGFNDLLEKHGRQIPEDGPVNIDDIDEAKAYVSKVHMAAVEMHTAMTVELKVLGVPFFGTKPEHVKRNGNREVSQNGGSLTNGVKITERELLDLQRKMVQYLEDMYG
ncbi:hypothetical protein NA57DRAFT_77533 [Rhizodiscina lignyota]|uniref:Uncharacterized protein n=1 Tax=Rhizodiscina lignyota TaxID=1504668 RepID=A0A9P4IDY6_9PEZI|nr:hypothetical protein NA57DRAFT_77533 [Rhizodiscina lignyota]